MAAISTSVCVQAIHVLGSFVINDLVRSKITYLSFGTYPDMSLAEAREKALEARKMLADGIDPQLAKEEQKAKVIVEQNATFKFIAEQWKAKKEGQIKEKTLNGNWRKLELYAFPKPR